MCEPSLFISALFLSILILGSVVGLVISLFYTIAGFIGLYKNVKDYLTGNVERIYPG